MLIMAINSIFFSCPGDKTFSGVIESLTNIIEPGAVVTFGLLNISSNRPFSIFKETTDASAHFLYC